MKVIISIVFVLASAKSEDPFGENEESNYRSVICPSWCLGKGEFRSLVSEAQGFVLKFRDWLVDGGELSENIAPNMTARKWESMCNTWTNVRTCTSRCTRNTLADTMHKQLVDHQAQAGIDFSCDKDIQTTYDCLTKVAKTPLGICNSKCDQYRTTASKAVKQYEDNSTTTFPSAIAQGSKKPTMIDAFSKNLCWFINCQLKCRESTILSNCKKAGIEAAKKGISALARTAEVNYFAYIRSAPMGEVPFYPEECTTSHLVRGFAQP